MTQSRAAQSGFTLIELMIAVFIGLFLMGGLLTLVSAMKRTSGIESSLGALHDSERMALTMVNDVVQQAGYFPAPLTNSAAAQFLVVAPFTSAGQSIYGTDAGTGGAPLDELYVRYASAGGDGVMNCAGAVSPVGTPANWISRFRVDGSGNFQCLLTTNGAAAAQWVTLATGVKYLGILYGVQTNPASKTFSVDRYLTATQVAGNWGNVISVQFTLYFNNPLSNQPGQTAATIPVTRMIAIMNRVGVNT
jgi:type IV pilus assembly protein PilW